MTHQSGLVKATILLVLGALGLTGASSVLSDSAAVGASASVPGDPHRAMLLVSLEDGSVIKQMIDIDADICFKQNASSDTLCLTQGAPVVDEATQSIIGYEMIEDRIDLIAASD